MGLNVRLFLNVVISLVKVVGYKNVLYVKFGRFFILRIKGCVSLLVRKVLI